MCTMIKAAVRGPVAYTTLRVYFGRDPPALSLGSRQTELSNRAADIGWLVSRGPTGVPRLPSAAYLTTVSVPALLVGSTAPSKDV